MRDSIRAGKKCNKPSFVHSTLSRWLYRGYSTFDHSLPRKLHLDHLHAAFQTFKYFNLHTYKRLRL